jgi:nucleoside-diphosphate-sugar epimerase
MKNLNKKILLTGGFGYVGSKICQYLKEKNFEITIVDNLLQKNYNKNLLSDKVKFHKLDLNNYKKLEAFVKKNNFDIVIHLAAIVGDPASKKLPKLTEKTNLFASKKLFKLCVKYKINKFIFFSTCSNYGLSKSNYLLKENSALKPLSIYAKTKVKFEKFLLQDKNKISKIILRISTLFGVSPRMRYDLTINEFTKYLFLGKKLDVFDASTWRPYIHLNDLANVVHYFINKNLDFRPKVFNTGVNGANYTKKDICNSIIKQMPNRAKFISYSQKPSKDKRNYKVDFSKISKLKIKNNYNLDKGIKEIIHDLKKNKDRQKFKKIFSNI